MNWVRHPAIQRASCEVQDLWSWWAERLRVLAAEALARWLPANARTLIIRQIPQGLELVHEIGDHAEPLGILLPNDLALDPSVAADAAWLSLFSTYPRVRVELDPASVFMSTLRFPDRLSARLHEAVEMRLMNDAPLPMEQLAVSWYRQTPQEDAAGSMKVRVALVRRSTLEQWHARLVKVGLPDGVCTYVDGTQRLTFDAAQAAARDPVAEITERRWQWAVAATAVALIGVVAGQRAAETWALRQARAEVVESALRAKADYNTYLIESEPLKRLSVEADRAQVLETLLTLTQTLPQEAWTYELELKRAESGDLAVRMAGFAPNASAVVDVLEASARFDRVSLVSSNSAPVSMGGTRFEIGARATIDSEEPP